MNKRIKHLIIDFKPITPRIWTLRIRGKFFIYSFINGHEPAEISDDEEKDGVFDVLQTAYDTSPINDTKIVLGNFNARVGKEPVNFPTIGNYSLHSLTNYNGSQLIQMKVSQNMITGSAFHPHKDIHKSKWRLPDGTTFNQLEHLLIDRRHKSNLMDVRSYRDANIDSDHHLVIACQRARISNVKQLALEPENTMYQN